MSAEGAEGVPSADVQCWFVNDAPEHQHLRVLIANQRSDRLDYVTGVVAGLGHEVVARSIEVGEVAA